MLFFYIASAIVSVISLVLQWKIKILAAKIEKVF